MSDARDATHSVLELSEVLQLPDESAYIIGAGGEIMVSAGATPVPNESVREAIKAIGQDTDRAARHLGFAGWESVVIESEGGVLGIGRAGTGDQRLAVVACPAETPVGRVQRIVASVAGFEVSA
jgi:hypothetical protein